jgi:hypothetical protein
LGWVGSGRARGFVGSGRVGLGQVGPGASLGRVGLGQGLGMVRLGRVVSRCWRRRAGVRGEGTQQSTRGGKWNGGVGGDKHVMKFGRRG